ARDRGRHRPPADGAAPARTADRGPELDEADEPGVLRRDREPPVEARHVALDTLLVDRDPDVDVLALGRPQRARDRVVDERHGAEGLGRDAPPMLAETKAERGGERGGDSLARLLGV